MSEISHLSLFLLQDHILVHFLWLRSLSAPVTQLQLLYLRCRQQPLIFLLIINQSIHHHEGKSTVREVNHFV